MRRKKDASSLLIRLIPLYSILLISTLHLVASEQSQYSRCKLNMEGILARRNAESLIHIYLACFDGTEDVILINGEAPTEDLTPDLFTAPGTPLKFFPEGGGLVHIADHEEGVFELYDSAFDSLLVEMASAPLVIENAKVRLVDCKFMGNNLQESGGLLLDTPVTFAPGTNLKNFKATLDNEDAPLVPATGPTVEIVNGFFENLGGGAVVINSFPYVYMNDSHFVGNYEAAVRYTTGATVLIENSKFENPYGASGQSKMGGVGGSGSVLFWARNSHFVNMNMWSGGAVAWTQGAGIDETILRFSNCTMSDNKGTNGGAVYAKGAMTVIVENSTLESNHAKNYGGCVYVQGTFQVNITGSTLRAGKATSGGAIYADYRGMGGEVNPETVVIQDSILNGNTAENGGAVFMEGDQSAGLGTFDSKFNDNDVGGHGGAMHLNHMQLVDVRHVDFVGNTLVVDRHSGGGIYAEAINEMRIVDSRFEGNSAMDPDCEEPADVGSGGGAIFVKNNEISRKPTLLQISNCKFQSNHAKVVGGDLNLESIKNVTITDTVLSMGLAHRGGSIESASVKYITMENVTVTGNEACGWDGGAMHISQSTQVAIVNSLFENNTATSDISDGGAVRVIQGGSMTLTGSNFTDNFAGSKAGALYVKKLNTLEISYSRFVSNEGQNGGAIRLAYVTQVVIVGSEFNNNTALESIGGAVEAESVKELDIQDTIFQHSTAKVYGGALYTESTDSLTLSNCLFKGHSAQKGGAIYTDDIEAFSIQGTELTECRATMDGGALLLSDVRMLDVTLSKILKSEAGGNGGAVWMTKGDSVTFSESDLGQNEGRIGGGVFLDGVKEVVVSGGSLYENSGERGGGGMSITNVASVKVSDHQVIGNTANEGGGLLIEKASNEVNLEGVEFDSNKVISGGGGGILLRDVQNVQGSDLNFKGDMASLEGSGAALLMENGQIFNLTGTSNVAGGKALNGGGFAFDSVERVSMSGLTFTNNIAFQKGGSLITTQVTSFSCIKCKFGESKAPEGGGMHSDSTDQITISSSQFVECFASETHGGGLSVYSTQQLVISNTLVTSPYVKEDGAAFYLSNVGSTVIEGGRVTYARAGGNGGMVHAKSGGVLTMQGVKWMNASAENGAFGCMTDMQYVALSGSDFDQGLSQTSGGGFYIERVNAVEVSDTEISDTKASNGMGGALLLVNVPHIITSSSKFSKTMASGAGGSIFAQNALSFIADFLTFEHAHTVYSHGGALHISNITNATLGTTTFTDCRTSVSSDQKMGGGLYLLGSENAVLEVVKFSECKAGTGGGAYVDGVGKLSVTNVDVMETYARGAGGGIYVGNVKENVDMQSMQIENTKSEKASGGGLMVENVSNFNLLDSKFISTEAGLDGGAIQIHFPGSHNENETTASDSKIVIENSEFTKTVAHGGSGGSVQITQIPDSNLITSYFKNGIEGSGGNLKESGGNLKESGGNLKESGGNLKESGGNLGLDLNNAPDVSIRHCVFTECGASGSESANGGAFNIESVRDVNMSDITISDTNAGGNGGGFAVDRALDVSMTRCVFGNTVAGENGGGMWLNHVNDVQISECGASGCTAQDGGGCYIRGNAEIGNEMNGGVVIDDSKFVGNDAQGEGGAVDVGQFDTVELENVAMKDNKAHEGGALALTAADTVTLTDSSISNNEANGGNGGGVLVSDIAHLTLSNMNLTQNSGHSGGGIHAQDIQKMELVSSTVSDSDASHYGGAMYLDSVNEVVSEGSEFVGNKAEEAGAMMLTGDTSLQMSDSVIKENVAKDFVGSNMMTSCDSEVTVEDSYVGIPYLSALGPLTQERSLEQAMYQDSECPESTILLDDSVTMDYRRVGVDVMAIVLIAVIFAVALGSLCMVFSVLGMGNPIAKAARVFKRVATFMSKSKKYGRERRGSKSEVQTQSTGAPYVPVFDRWLLDALEQGIGWSEPSMRRRDSVNLS